MILKKIPCSAACVYVTFKAALADIFTFPMDQMTVCKVKGLARGDKPLVNYLSTLQFSSSPRSVLSSFNSLLWIYGLQLYCFGSSLLFPNLQLQVAVFSKNFLLNQQVHYLLSTTTKLMLILFCVCWLWEQVSVC